MGMMTACELILNILSIRLWFYDQTSNPPWWVLHILHCIQAEFKHLGFGYTEAVSKLLKTPRHTNPASSLLPSKKMGGAADSWLLIEWSLSWGLE